MTLDEYLATLFYTLLIVVPPYVFLRLTWRDLLPRVRQVWVGLCEGVHLHEPPPPPAPLTWGNDWTDSGRLLEHLPCLECGTDLHGLTDASPCPTCGQPVAASQPEGPVLLPRFRRGSRSGRWMQLAGMMLVIAALFRWVM